MKQQQQRKQEERKSRNNKWHNWSKVKVYWPEGLSLMNYWLCDAKETFIFVNIEIYELILFSSFSYTF